MFARRPAVWTVAAMMLAFVAVGCETNLAPGTPLPDDPDDVGAAVIPPAIETPDPAIEPDEPADLPPDPPFGTWRLSAGSVLVPLGSMELQALTLNEDGTGHQTYKHPTTGALQRIELLHVFDGKLLHLSYLLSIDAGARYDVTIDNLNAMRFVGDVSVPAGLVEGRIATFSRMTDVPDDLRFGSLDIVKRFDGLGKPVSQNDLVSDGTSLFYQTPDEGFREMQKIDPDTGAVLDTFMSFSGSQIILAMQDGGFWAHCGCGGSNDARLADGTVADTVDTVDLGKPVQIHSMAFDDVGRILWIAGHDAQVGNRMLKINADAEPDVLLDSGPFDHFLKGMTVDGADLWTIIDEFGGPRTTAIVQFDSTTLKAKRSFHTPDPKVTWTGITMHGDRLFLLGFDAANQGVIMEVAPS